MAGPKDELGRIDAHHDLDVGVVAELAELLDAATIDPQLSQTDTPQPWSIPAPAPPTRERYLDEGLLGRGGMGEVRRVHDLHLNRRVARKQALPGADSRFLHEAQVAAQLQHPGIVPVYDVGEGPEGPWFTMREIEGRTLREVLRELRAGETPLRRVVDLFVRVCEAMAYAHARGVVHRDLKPDNVMVGRFGEVLVLDWGLAKVAGQADPALHEGRLDPVVTERALDLGQRTRLGVVQGTPRFMSPEQARGEVDRLDARTDVYALGAILYQVLSGEAPYAELSDVHAVLDAVRSARPLPPLSGPDELVELVEACMRPEPEDRPDHAGVLAERVEQWLDGALKRARALEWVERAAAVLPKAEEARQRAARLRKQAGETTDTRAAWRLEDEAEGLEQVAEVLEAEHVQRLQSALTHADLPEAHDALAAWYRAAHEAAERGGDRTEARRIEVFLRAHDRGAHTAYLAGDGSLTLRSDVPAEATLYRLERVDRQRVPRGLESRALPLEHVALAMGSYLVEVRAPGRPVVRYPVALDRQRHWEGAVRIPEDLGPDDVFVPAGWFWAGDATPGTQHFLPRQRVWMHDLVVRRFPVTNGEYLAFLDALDVAEAQRHAPKAPGAFRMGPDGWELGEDEDGHRWEPDYPVLYVDWHDARAFAAWEAARTGLAWRLPGELEWEKAARGVDGRTYPWGDHFDPRWCRNRATPEAAAGPAPVDSFPEDASVYGVRGMAGNVMDWCLDPTPHLPPIDAEGRALPPRQGSASAHRAVRGGRWFDPPVGAQLARRRTHEPSWAHADVGIRLVRSIER